MSNPNLLTGVASPADQTVPFDALHFFVTRILSRVNTATLVRVLDCTNDGGVSPVGTVDVQPLVQQMTATGQTVPQPTVYQVPYFRLQGGASAVILDPMPGDIGIAIFADHDISGVKATVAESAPGSFRRFNMADGLYVGGFINGVPNQYVQFLPNGGGINLLSPGAITMQGSEINLVGPVNQSGGVITAAQDVVINGLSTINHNHPGVQTGSGNTGGMQG